MFQCKDLDLWGQEIRNTQSFVKFALELHKNLNLLLVIFSLPLQVSFKFQSSSSSLFSFKCQTIHHFALSPFPVNLKVLLVRSNVSLGQCALITQNNVLLVTLPISACELSRTVQELLLSPSPPCYHVHNKRLDSNIHETNNDYLYYSALLSPALTHAEPGEHAALKGALTPALQLAALEEDDDGRAAGSDGSRRDGAKHIPSEQGDTSPFVSASGAMLRAPRSGT